MQTVCPLCVHVLRDEKRTTLIVNLVTKRKWLLMYICGKFVKVLFIIAHSIECQCDCLSRVDLDRGTRGTRPSYCH